MNMAEPHKLKRMYVDEEGRWHGMAGGGVASIGGTNNIIFTLTAGD